MEEIFKKAKEIGFKQIILEVCDFNIRAIKLYEKYGFKKCGLLPNYVNIKDEFFGKITMYLNLIP